MKKTIIGFGVIAIITLTSFAANSKSFNNSEETTEFVECKYGQCKAKAKSTGKTCLHCVSNSGDSYCWQHK